MLSWINPTHLLGLDNILNDLFCIIKKKKEEQVWEPKTRELVKKARLRSCTTPINKIQRTKV